MALRNDYCDRNRGPVCRPVEAGIPILRKEKITFSAIKTTKTVRKQDTASDHHKMLAANQNAETGCAISKAMKLSCMRAGMGHLRRKAHCCLPGGIGWTEASAVG